MNVKIGKRYFLSTLVAPIIIPVLFALTGVENIVFGILIVSLIFGGIPYLVFCIGVLVWSRNKNVQQIRKLSYIAPIIYSAVFSVFLTIWIVIENKEFPDFVEFFQVGALFAIYCMVVGYAYVLIVNFIYEITLSKHEDR